jgi:hypothetical protein
MQATGFIAASNLEPFLRCLPGSLTIEPTTRRSQKLQRLLALQIPLQVGVGNLRSGYSASDNLVVPFRMNRN